MDAVVCGKTVHALRMTLKGRTRSAGNFARGRLVRIGALKRAPFEHGAFGRPQTSCQKRFQKRKPMQKINFFACGSRATKTLIMCGRGCKNDVFANRRIFIILNTILEVILELWGEQQPAAPGLGLVTWEHVTRNVGT